MQNIHFTVAYWCVLLAVLLPYACAALVKFSKVPAGQLVYDNVNPRAWLALQTQWRARANNAQANGFEALPFFIGAVIIAHQMGAEQGRLDLMAFFFIVLRVLYCMAYVSGMSGIRSVLWALAFMVNVGIFFLGYH